MDFLVLKQYLLKLLLDYTTVKSLFNQKHNVPMSKNITLFYKKGYNKTMKHKKVTIFR